MRTPGHDAELAVGFLFTEGIVTDPDQVAGVRPCGSGNAVRVDLRPGVTVDFARLERHFYATSSCGVCGKASLEAVRVACGLRCPPPGGLGYRSSRADSVIRRLPSALRSAQSVFDRTGGLARLGRSSTPEADLLGARRGRRPPQRAGQVYRPPSSSGRADAALLDAILLVSGRASFELVQKAAACGIPILAFHVGVPSSLAVGNTPGSGDGLIRDLRRGCPHSRRLRRIALAQHLRS